MRLLVVGAGASIEEQRRSGERAAQPFPTVQTFCSYWDKASIIPLPTICIARYLDANCIPYNRAVLDLYEGRVDSLSAEHARNDPLQVIERVSRETPEQHNAERVYEFVWNEIANDSRCWATFVEHTVFIPVYLLQIQNFFENGKGWKELSASKMVCSWLTDKDRVINLNYDTVFDIALKQVGLRFSYSPFEQQGGIRLYKPHGSLNFYFNDLHNELRAIEPDELPGTIHYPDDRGGTWHPRATILPPRLNKKYHQHPVTRLILGDVKALVPEILTFWGIGLTDSDIELSRIYRFAATSAKRIEFINPDTRAFEKAHALLRKPITHFRTLEEWQSEKKSQ